jgi:acetoin utilization deacetylase AcuC-like enzyme
VIHALGLMVSNVMGCDEQENERRIDVLAGAAGCLFREPFQGKLHWVQSSAIKPASLVDVLRVHEWDYIRHLQRVCDESSRHQGEQKPKRGWSKLVPPVAEKAGFAPDVGYLDIDTIVSPASVNAARHAAGAAIHAVDLLAERRMRKDASVPTAFVVCRPPGHHAGARGCVPAAGYWRRPDMTSSGFCLINNVGIAAAYARCHSSRTTFSKIAIIDFDIHHGNGTEDIVKNLRPREQFFPLPGSWAPMKYETFKPWLNEDDSESVFFASINLFEVNGFTRR